MKKTLLALLALFSITISSCFFGGRDYKKANEAWEGRWRRIKEVNSISHEENVRQNDLSNAIRFGLTHDESMRLDKLKQYLEEGYDPNRSCGEEWSERTPLYLVARSFYSSWLSIEFGREISDPPPDIEVFQLLVDAGADVNQWPYIWLRVYKWDNWHLDNWIRDAGPYFARLSLTKEETERGKEQVIFYYVNDANRIIEAFLKAGADPDKFGHPYPFSPAATHRWISEEEAREYFAKGTRPINEAIKKGIRWESQVDLLLQYTMLDVDSLEAARESNDPAMIEKITRLWDEQNAER